MSFRTDQVLPQFPNTTRALDGGLLAWLTNTSDRRLNYRLWLISGGSGVSAQEQPLALTLERQTLKDLCFYVKESPVAPIIDLEDRETDVDSSGEESAEPIDEEIPQWVYWSRGIS